MNLSRISKLVEPIRERWIAAGATARDGASAEDLHHFELKYGVSLPADVVAFYRGVDGMASNDWDEELIRWWPIAEVKPVNEDLELVHDTYGGHFAFADWSLCAHAYALELASGSTHGRVVIAGSHRPIPVAASFTEFLDLYIARSDRLYAVRSSEGSRRVGPRSSMIVWNDIMSELIAACPSFTPTWQAFQSEWRDEANSLPLYLVLADFGRHLISMIERGDLASLPSVFAAIERLHVEGEPRVREAATIGILESLQNHNLHKNGTDPEAFVPYLGPESARWWGKLHRFWQHGGSLTDD